MKYNLRVDGKNQNRLLFRNAREKRGEPTVVLMLNVLFENFSQTTLVL